MTDTRKRRSIWVSAVAIALSGLLVVGIPSVVAAATSEYYVGVTAKNDYRYSGYRVWTKSQAYAHGLPCCLVMQAKAGTYIAEGTGGASLTIPTSQRVNRYISCRWVSDGGWGQSSWSIMCLGEY